MNLRTLCVAVVLLLFGAACGGDGDESPSASETDDTSEPTDVATEPTSDEPSDASTEEPTDGPSDASTEEPTDGPSDAPAEVPTDEPSAGAGTSGATLTIGDETWSFDQVNFCAMSPPEDETLSFLMISIQDDLQLSVRITDPTGERRLEGEGVWDQIDFINTADTTLNLWLASSQTTGQQFVVVEGPSVTASAAFVDLRTDDPEGIPGTLDATCP